MAMKRQLFHIPQDQIDRLHTLAAQRQVSTGELVRRFIEQGLARLGSRSEVGEENEVAVIQRQLADMASAMRLLESRVTALEQRTF